MSHWLTDVSWEQYLRFYLNIYVTVYTAGRKKMVFMLYERFLTYTE